MLVWYPKLQHLPIPQIRTEIVKTGSKPLRDFVRKNIPLDPELVEQFQKAIKIVGGYPVFMRTDQASDKHSWSDTCYVESAKNLTRNILMLIEFHEMVDMAGEMNYEALIFRELLELETSFTAFRNFPVNKEIRCFIKDHKLVSMHNYWFEDALVNQTKDKDWKEKLKKLNVLYPKDKDEIKSQLNYVVREFEGYWSVDFAKATDGEWYLIDMARGEVSYHADKEIK